uniref:Fibromodulin n=1 Tax=Sinocyclocheilus grahami TaxID=75366 RepID=A0A672TEU6_SINGR
VRSETTLEIWDFICMSLLLYIYLLSEDEDEPPVLDCPLECDCTPSYPSFFPSHIKYVYLQNNQITTITNGVFDNAPNLAWISLYTNKLNSDKIGDKVFAKLPNLQRLFLHNNNLSRVPQGLPRSLRDLHMNHNNISKIPVESFHGMSNLTALHLQVNAIEDLGNALEGLHSLTLLDLRGNRLKKIPESLPPMLSQLYLEYNRISSVPADFLSQRPELRFVRLSHNQLTNGGIPTNAFNFSTLVELDLSFNKLERIPTISTSLENLYLQANKIKGTEKKKHLEDVTTQKLIRHVKGFYANLLLNNMPVVIAYFKTATY